jgi:malonyl-CoA/methylmalonyl-CoA synthetase
VPDEEFGQRVGAVLTLHEEESSRNEFKATYGKGMFRYTIEDLRKDLKDRLAGYKMPTLLRVVEGDLPKTASGKVLKKKLGLLYFPDEWEGIADVQSWAPKSKGVSRPEIQAKL